MVFVCVCMRVGSRGWRTHAQPHAARSHLALILPTPLTFPPHFPFHAHPFHQLGSQRVNLAVNDRIYGLCLPPPPSSSSSSSDLAHVNAVVERMSDVVEVRSSCYGGGGGGGDGGWNRLFLSFVFVFAENASQSRVCILMCSPECDRAARGEGLRQP